MHVDAQERTKWYLSCGGFIQWKILNILVKCVKRIHMVMYTGEMTEFSLLHNDGYGMNKV